MEGRRLKFWIAPDVEVRVCKAARRLYLGHKSDYARLAVYGALVQSLLRAARNTPRRL